MEKNRKSTNVILNEKGERPFLSLGFKECFRKGGHAVA
jgi:hypothetical protein